MKNRRLVIFDLDGTLVDAYSAIAMSFNYTMKTLGYPKQGKLVIRRAVGRGDENLLRPFIKNKDKRKALNLYRYHHKTALIKYSRLFPRVKSLLSHLKREKYKIAVASNRPTRFSRILIRRLGLGRYFNYVLCADKLKHLKPHPEILNKILQRFSLKPEYALYVGDMTIDARAGRRAKVKTCIVTTGSSTRGEIKKERPYMIIGKIADLFDFL